MTPTAPPSQHNEIFSSPEIHPIYAVKVNAGLANPNVDGLLMAADNGGGTGGSLHPGMGSSLYGGLWRSGQGV